MNTVMGTFMVAAHSQPIGKVITWWVHLEGDMTVFIQAKNPSNRQIRIMSVSSQML